MRITISIPDKLSENLKRAASQALFKCKACGFEDHADLILLCHKLVSSAITPMTTGTPSQII
jgi:hypothetical protein